MTFFFIDIIKVNLGIIQRLINIRMSTSSTFSLASVPNEINPKVNNFNDYYIILSSKRI